jgi:hypothetical protein
MTKSSMGSLRYDVMAASLILASGLAELLIREQFHRFSFEMLRILGVLIVWSAILLSATWTSSRRRPRRCVAHGHEIQCEAAWFGPALVGIAVAVWVYVIYGPWLTNALGSTLGPEFGPVLVLFALVATLTGAGAKLPASTWSALRRGVSAAGVIFVLSQPALAHWSARDIIWPKPQTTDSTATPAPEIQVFVLLDELNDKAAEPISAAMSRSGRPVYHRALVPVADGTLKVVPTLFARTPFPDAKPCSLNTVCSGNQVLDFSRIHASRTDIDVVGFFLPYCAIQGLRSCHVEKLASRLFSMERWRCAFMRRSEVVAHRAAETERRHCVEVLGTVWADLATDVEKRIWQAPVWRDGGVLFVHMPLPHPPGRDPSQGLAANYAANLERAAMLIGRMAESLGREQSRRFSLVVFSDHPLRTSMWCGSAQYKGAGCPADETLIDDRVPLLVAGDVPATFGHLRSNQDVFDLLR